MSETPGNRSPILNFMEKGTGTPLVLIHGLMMSHQMFERVVQSLLKNTGSFARTSEGMVGATD
jgi:pimeloyl-ACP methyl ester carboxylesterase